MEKICRCGVRIDLKKGSVSIALLTVIDVIVVNKEVLRKINIYQKLLE